MIAISEEDIRIAYKKTKYTLANDKNLVIADEIVEFEENFDANIKKTLDEIKNILSSDPSNWDKNIGKNQIALVPKEIDCSKNTQEKEEEKTHFFSNSPRHYHKNFKTVKFREVANIPLSMHIFSTLWVIKVGERLDRKLSKNIYCSRLYRVKDNDKVLNTKTNKLFYPYFDNYKNWRNKCFKKIREVHKVTSVVAVTLDISNFYGSIDLSYFTSDIFYETFGLHTLFDQDKGLEDFHNAFIQYLQQINSHLLIGLTCSPVLANSRLYEWDNHIEKISPIYYGRYMDDILLVFSSYPNLRSSENVVEFLLNQNLITYCEENKKMFLRLSTNTEETFELKQSKQKFFYFDKKSDLSMLDAIEMEIEEISSEWNFIPDVASSNSSLYKKALGLCGDQDDFNNALRKVETIKLKRLGLSLLISNAFALNEYVAPKDWFNQRKKIYDLVINHLLIPENFFRNYDYVFRLFGLMISSDDFGIAKKFLNDINKLIDLWNPNDIEEEEKKNKFQEYHKKKTEEIFISSLNPRQSYEEKELEKIIKCATSSMLEQIKEKNIRFFLSDLCLKSFASEVILIIHNHEKCKRLYKKIVKIFDDFYENFIKKNGDQEKIFSPMFYLNRRFLPFEISELVQKKCKAIGDIEDITLQMITRLIYHSNHKEQNANQEIVDIKNKEDEKQNPSQKVVSIENEKYKEVKTLKVAIANFKIPNEYWEQSIKNKPNRSIKRYNQLQEIVNSAIKTSPDYLVLPELAIPSDWAHKISKKLLQHRISLITGVEYIHDGAKLHNPVKMFLISDDLGYPYTKAFRQDKSEPAHEEANTIQNKCGYTVEPHLFFKEKKIYRHGDFFFSVLICNEFTDIGNRAKLRGNIDALFVVEWNKDIKSFNTYVESASLDIHCYVIQANNGQYGDSRIRAPYKEDYKRDIVRITGQGSHDVLIVGEINIGELCKFQSNCVTTNSTFKPVPTGFEMNKERKKWNTSKDLETEINTK